MLLKIENYFVISLSNQTIRRNGTNQTNIIQLFCAANNTEIEKDKSDQSVTFTVGVHNKFKETGVKFLDLGSYDENNLNDEKFNNIIKFKKGFGPKVIDKLFQ